MLNAVIMQAVPGSGKTTYVHREIRDINALCSSDLYEGLYGPMGEFNFNLLGKAHGWCFKQAIYAADTGKDGTIVVDNTNLSVAELAPYVALFAAYEIPTTIVTLLTDPVKAAARNVHGVPADRVVKMYELMLSEHERWPSHWKYIPHFRHEQIVVSI